jgi:hypothetical protein
MKLFNKLLRTSVAFAALSSGGVVSAAETAAVVPPVAPAASDAKPTEVPFDLNTMPSNPMLDGETIGASDQKLEIYGFADFTYAGFIMPKEGRWNGFLNRYPGMGIGNLNVYLKGSLSDRARSLVEIRFLYLPNGQSQVQSDGSVKYTDTKVLDPLELNRALKWGGIQIQRAWVEYDLLDALTVRVGQFLTPYGIWNVDHGSPTIIGIRRPFVITEALFPEQQTGVEIYGRRNFSNALLGYHLTFSNGRGVGEEYQDRDYGKAFGGRVFATNRFFGEITTGASFYTAGGTMRKERWTLGADGQRIFVATDVERSRDVAFAADLNWRGENLRFQSEVVARRRTYAEDARERLNDYPYPAFAPNNYRWGMYGLLSYRTSLAGITPYLLYEKVTFAHGDIPQAQTIHFGLNYRPDPALVLKAEMIHAHFPGALKTSFGVDNLTTYAMQVAWVF